MALLTELTEYRSLIMKLLCSNQKIVDLVKNSENSVVPDRSLIYTRIFPYPYTPDVTKDTNTYVCFRVYVPEVMNKTFKKMNICFYIFSHEDHIRTSTGLRPDLIAEQIEIMLNGSLDLGVGRMRLESMDDISPTQDFHGIMLEYSVSEFNRPAIHTGK